MLLMFLMFYVINVSSTVLIKRYETRIKLFSYYLSKYF